MPNAVAQVISIENLIGYAVRSNEIGERLRFRNRGARTEVWVDAKKVAVVGGLPNCLVVGCDLQGYGSLSDLQQLAIGLGLRRAWRRLLRQPQWHRRILGVNETGDGILFTLRPGEDREALRLAYLLWRAGRAGFEGCRKRLRVAVAAGPCITGPAVDAVRGTCFGGRGLVRAVRLLAAEPGVTFVVQRDVWQRACGTGITFIIGDGANRVRLRRSRALRRKRVKRSDGEALEYWTMGGIR